MRVEIENYTKTIKGATVLSDISLNMESGKVYGLRGHNGCGKTMLMRAISGLILPTSGCVKIDGQAIGRIYHFPPSIGLLIEYPAFINSYTGFKNLKMIADIQKKIGDDKIRDAIKKVGLDPDDKRTFKKYSLGMKQKLGIACAIMEEPDLIILDEPVNALDEAGKEVVRTILQENKERGALIILACHDADELNYLSDEIYIMSEGKLIGRQE